MKESEIRGLIGHATSLASNDISGPDAERLLDEMVAEERRIYERAMEREQQLFDLEGTVRELHRAADKLMRAAETLHGSSENEEPPHLSQLGKGRR